MIEDKVSNLIYSHYDVTFECVSVHIRVFYLYLTQIYRQLINITLSTMYSDLLHYTEYVYWTAI